MWCCTGVPFSKQADDQDGVVLLKGIKRIFNMKHDLARGYKNIKSVLANPNTLAVKKAMNEVYGCGLD